MWLLAKGGGGAFCNKRQALMSRKEEKKMPPQYFGLQKSPFIYKKCKKQKALLAGASYMLSPLPQDSLIC